MEEGSSARKLLDGETLIWSGRPAAGAWPWLTVLGWATAIVLVGIIPLTIVAARRKMIAWVVTSRRIETTRGWFSTNIETLELWRVRDVAWSQGLLERLFGVATITVLSQDQQEPRIELRGVPGDRTLYDQLSNAVMTARQQRGVLNVTE